MPIVYQTTNNLNNKVYIGYHNGTDDSYLGSGTALAAAINKYGKENFTRETVFEGTKEECLELEEFIVDEEFVLCKSNYNLTVGGGMPPVLYGNTHTLGRIVPAEELEKRSESLQGINRGDKNGMRKEGVAQKMMATRADNLLKRSGVAHPSQLPEARKAVSKTASKNIKEKLERPIVKELQTIVDNNGLHLGRNWQRKRTDDLEEILRSINS